MTGLNASRSGEQIDSTSLGAGTVKNSILLTAGNDSTVTLRRESCQPLAIGHNKPIIKKYEAPGFITRLNTAVLAYTADNNTETTANNSTDTTNNSQYTLFGFNDAVLTTPTGNATQPYPLSYPHTKIGTMIPAWTSAVPEVFGDPSTGIIDAVSAFRTYNVTFNSPVSSIINSGQLTVGHWEVNRNGSVSYYQYTSNNQMPTRLQGIFNFTNPVGLSWSSWNVSPNVNSQPYISTIRTTLVLSGPSGLGIKLDGKKGIMVNKSQIPTDYYSTHINNRIRAHMNRSNDNIIRGTLPVSLDDPVILYNTYKVICSSSQGREL